MSDANSVNDLFVKGLKNAHAMEKQALSIIKPQVDRIEKYPELRARLEAHIEETNRQLERLDGIFEIVKEKHSALKDLVLSTGGSMAALSHAAAVDEILKDTFANFAFEHYEIAAYRSLAQLAEMAGHQQAVDLLNQSLSEEQAMATWIEDHLDMMTERFVGLSSTDEQAKR